MKRLALAGCFLVAFSLVDSPSLRGQEVVEGTVLNPPKRSVRRGRCPVINPKCVSLYFIVAAGTRDVAVLMEGGVIDGTVFEGHRVRVEGEWGDGNRLHARRIMDLRTGATIGQAAADLRFARGDLSLTGEVISFEEKHADHPDRMNPQERQYFLLRLDGQDAPVVVEIVKREIRGTLSQNRTVRVDGRWTERNVLRADRVQDTQSGEVVN